MARSAFEGSRGGVHHRYELGETALVYSAGRAHGEPKTAAIPYTELKRLEPGHGGSLYLVRKNGQKFGLWVRDEQMPAFLRALVAAWVSADRDHALKSAYDYGAEERSVGWIALVLSLSFPGLLSLLLLSDGYNERRCSRLLEQGQVAEARVAKIKKNRRGNFVWTLEFEGAGGAKIEGKREAIAHGAGGKPLGDKETATIIYSAENANCWDVSMTPGQPVPNRRQRHFVELMNLSFGWMFALLTFFGVGWSVRRIRLRKPWRAEVRAATEAHMRS